MHTREKTLSCCIGTSLDVQHTSCFHSSWQVQCFFASILGKGVFVTKPLDALGLAAAPAKERQEFREYGDAKGDPLVKDAVVAKCLLAPISVFLRASKSRMANVLLLFPLVACSLS